MVDTAAARRETSTAAEHSWLGELLLRLLGAALQILATWAVVHALTPDEAGIYFRGRLDAVRFRRFIVALVVVSVINLLWRTFAA